MVLELYSCRYGEKLLGAAQDRKCCHHLIDSFTIILCRSSLKNFPLSLIIEELFDFLDVAAASYINGLKFGVFKEGKAL